MPRWSAMTARPRILAALLLVAAAVAGCETQVVRPQFPDITFAHRPAIVLSVGTVTVETAYRAPLAAPNVEHLMAQPPAKVVERWARDRLEAGGSGGRALFTVLDGTVTETRLETRKGLSGAFTTEQAERYDAAVEARLEVYDGSGRRTGFATARADRSKTLAEDATVNDRERLWYELAEQLAAAFDAEMEKNVRRHLGGWVLD